MDQRLIIGAMSGTSADGVDVALVAIPGQGATMRAALRGAASEPFSEALRRRVLTIRTTGAATLREVAAVTREITLVYAAAVHRLVTATHVKPADVLAIAAHGQTLFHDPPLTTQVFDPALLAWECGIDVISDFRRADCAAGGQGAPLVPWADAILYHDPNRDQCILNLGGIANVTLLPASGAGVTGFDVGPGNCISDALMADCGGFDAGGRRAMTGRADAAVVARFLEDEYVRRPPPKSTDGPAMIAAFENACGDRVMSLEDRLATAVSVVVACVVAQTPTNAELIVAGGGVENAAMMNGLRQNRRVRDSASEGVPAQYREAMAFALLGAATLDRVPANLPAVTGASRPVVLGAITPRP